MKQMPSTWPELLEKLRHALALPGSQWTAEENALWITFQQRYARAIYAIGRRWRLSHAECEILEGEVFTNAYRYLKGFRYDPERGRFRHWLEQVVRNQIISLLRKQDGRRREAPFPSAAIVDPRTPEPHQPLEQQEAQERNRQFVARLLQAVGQRDSRLIELVYLRGRLIVEAAKQLNMRPDTARQMLRRAIMLLRELFGDTSLEE